MWTRYLWVTILGLGLAGTSVFGAHVSSNQHHKTPPAAAPPAATPPPPATQPAPPTQLSQDQAAEVAAAKELASDNKALQTLSDALLANFHQTTDWTAGQSKLADAKSNLESAKKAAGDALASNPDYQDALAAKQKAIDDLNAAKASDDATPETLSPLASASMMASMKLKKVQNEVLSNDAGVQAASADVTVAQRAVDDLTAKFQQGLSADKDYAAARQAVADAQQKYDDARAKVASEEGQ
jgi:hypothetical protein